MSKYLYGAAVQGIQNFIFQTNELRDIAGASELVENICTKMFTEFEVPSTGGEEMVMAAGNIKYIFPDRESCEKAVLNFPRKVMTAAPGIVISQAVVCLDGFPDFGEAVDALEARLRAKRNCQALPLTTGLLGMTRSRNTGLPAVCLKDGEYLDESTLKKRDHAKEEELNKEEGETKNTTITLCRKSFGDKKIGGAKVAFNIEDITKDNDWIAIIHADGNGLGQVVQKVGRDQSKFHAFSNNLDEATKAAAQAAFQAITPEQGWEKRIPIRPVVLGGDDLTVIIRGDLAINYVAAYLEAFEEQTKEKLGAILRENHVFDDGRDYLTACAGVAFIKSSYPFYYGYNLAEELCSAAKKASGRKASCLMFHKVQDSFITSYSDISKRELTPTLDRSFKFGPYYIKTAPQGYFTVTELNEYCDKVDELEGVRSGLRRWLTLLHDNAGRAKQHLERLMSVQKSQLKLINALTDGHTLNPEFQDKDTDKDKDKQPKAVAAYDCLSLHSVKFQKTK